MWEISKIHKRILDKLFKNFSSSKRYKILDAGSGRTSLYFLTERFSRSHVLAIVFPGDERKIKGIKKSVKTKNFQLKQIDVQKFKQKKKEKFNIVLAHLLLGEATKFRVNTFQGILDALFKVKTDYLAIIDCIDDPEVDYRLILEYIGQKGEIQKLFVEGKYIAFLVKMFKTRG